jgi:hypothetical protein
LLQEIRTEVSKSFYRDVMGEMFHRLLSTRKRVIAERQLAMLNVLLVNDSMSFDELWKELIGRYLHQKSPGRAFGPDLSHLVG